MEGTNSSFLFETVRKEKIEKLITSLNIRKAVQSNDIPTKLVKEFGCLFSKYIATSVQRCITGGTFVNAFKKAKVWLIYKKTEKQKNLITDPLAFFQMYPKFMKDVYTSKCIPILTKYSLNINVVFVKTSILNKEKIAMIEKMKTSRDNKQFCAAILTNFSMVFDCTCCDLLLRMVLTKKH